MVWLDSWVWRKSSSESPQDRQVCSCPPNTITTKSFYSWVMSSLRVQTYRFFWFFWLFFFFFWVKIHALKIVTYIDMHLTLLSYALNDLSSGLNVFHRIRFVSHEWIYTSVMSQKDLSHHIIYYYYYYYYFGQMSIWLKRKKKAYIILSQEMLKAFPRKCTGLNAFQEWVRGGKGVPVWLTGLDEGRGERIRLVSQSSTQSEFTAHQKKKKKTVMNGPDQWIKGNRYEI